MPDTEPSIPRLFISYAWTSASHQQWVLDLATALRRDGVDVVLDVWDLKPGQDKYKFMEQLVVDPSINKVLLICNPTYVAKADMRAGGVGDETQIITPELYGHAESEKFVPVLAQLNDDGTACVPAYLRSRIYVDLSSEQVYYEGYERLLRLIHGAPAFPKPAIGEKPSFLTESATTGSSSTPLLRRAIHALEAEKRSSEPLTRDYLHTLANAIVSLRVRPDESTPLDELVFQAIHVGKIQRDEFLTILDTLCKFADGATIARLLPPFFEELIAGCYQRGPGSWQDSEFEPVRFILWELFLYTVAMLLSRSVLDALEVLLDDTFIFERNGNTLKTDYSRFCTSMESLDRARNARLQLRRTSVAADVLKDRADRNDLQFASLQEADLLLFVRSRLYGKGWWQPRTLVYLSTYQQPFEIFVAMDSKRRFAKLRAILGVESVEELTDKLKATFTQSDATLTLGDWPISVLTLLNLSEDRR
jgi:hypothetical protein